jgi:hypothetical protein
MSALPLPKQPRRSHPHRVSSPNAERFASLRLHITPTPKAFSFRANAAITLLIACGIGAGCLWQRQAKASVQEDWVFIVEEDARPPQSIRPRLVIRNRRRSIPRWPWNADGKRP